MNLENKTAGISELLGFTLKNKASDLHITSGQEPMLRIDGELVPVALNLISPEQILEMLKSIMSPQQFETYEKNLELDFAINYGSQSRFRVNAFFTIAGPAVAFRSSSEIPTLERINAPQQLFEFATYDKGLILVTGATGSGKSTTIAALVDYINRNRACHILTIEDPVEFVHKPVKSLINQREVGHNTKSFASALKNALREDPDVILIGEMRDLETIRLALTAAETGHLVLATLHTSSASKTINRIIDVFPQGDKDMARTMLSGSLRAVIAQKLIPANAGGRIAAQEILIVTPAIANLIREDQIHQIDSMIQVKKEQGMQTMNDAIDYLVLKGKISPEEALKSKKQAMETKNIVSNATNAPKSIAKEPEKTAPSTTAHKGDNEDPYSSNKPSPVSIF